ncbi:heme-binding domain-containing protein [Leptospira sp. 2 VSF19]|uniref:Heme-binding domain-containing protein n=1 Tax=Leptospira soteropolitanensis TaxID=2950025 RepID=A0AAW5VHR7_9LEPT|nr:heme-binding domain-containing protein [Leptospira soteropolitanensis]MCW7492278.1 heme-binding domain-containing protein [Leptospira soteropolitanensis]MCW7499860.1 heme-binding domain-containing protein [Leptospira soteropolitanensis]MCW7522111.1 heme-binding domain-containing protein [Leptospira soteropolitanensis]MCW7525965.1 heme-binding domain-containing protein [Leptospira soteropolitanensis]MCW7529921.1 heme-binding domain-containing protein [Leptospira soteropolitanensis]
MKRIFLILLGVFLLLQFFPINRSNPPVKSEIQTTNEIKEILKRSCYDCHSNETVWPAYSYIFPASLLISHHVEEGRDELNFSEFGLLSEKKQNKKIFEIWEQVEEDEMPPKDYLLLHPTAKLSDKDKEVLKKWSDHLSEDSE